MARAQKRSRSAKPASVLPPLAPRKRALHSIAPTRCRSASLAQRPVVERDARVADAVLMHARKKLALLLAGSRAEDVAEAKAKRHQAAAFLEERKAEFDQCTVRRPQPEPVKVLVTLGQYVSTFASTTLVQLKPDAK
jgi:HlyD family secretion protein